jgi:hypothetical protein
MNSLQYILNKSCSSKDKLFLSARKLRTCHGCILQMKKSDFPSQLLLLLLLLLLRLVYFAGNPQSKLFIVGTKLLAKAIKFYREPVSPHNSNNKGCLKEEEDGKSEKRFFMHEIAHFSLFSFFYKGTQHCSGFKIYI